jgi:disulfide bond formation protein DsbB
MNKLYKPFQWLWLAWLMMFVAIEVAALWLSRGKKPENEYQGGTLSELFWRTMKDPNPYFRAVATGALIGLFIVLTFHFFIQETFNVA